MRGFPLFNLVASLLLCFGALLPAVRHMTRSGPPAPLVQPPAASVSARPGRVMLKFVHAPLEVTLEQSGRALLRWSGGGAATVLDERITAEVADGRSEFLLTIRWPAGTPPTMVEVRFEPDGAAAWSQNVWAEGAAAEEVLNVAWEKPAE